MLDKKQRKIMDAICLKSKLDFVRIFGSSLSTKKSRDIDLVIGTKLLKLPEYSNFVSEMERIFKKKIDVIQLRSGLSPTLIIEIAKYSRQIWEKEKVGRAKYAELIDHLVGIAQDEKLSFPKELRKEAAKRVNRRLRVT